MAKGAWLYSGNCQRCHGDYAKARVAEDLSAKELKAAVSGDARPGCAIAWSLANGGPLPGKDIGALVAYMTAWEEAGAQPALPPLPPQPTRTPTPAPTVITTDTETTAAASVSPTPTPLAPELLAAFAADPVAHGAWLYTRNCQRCHQTYATARMGQGLDTELVKQRIQEGNPGSNMPAFSFRLGGPLKAADINAVVAFIATWEAAGGPPVLPPVVAAAVAAEAKAAAAAAVALPAGAAALEPAGTGLAVLWHAVRPLSWRRRRRRHWPGAGAVPPRDAPGKRAAHGNRRGRHRDCDDCLEPGARRHFGRRCYR